MFDNDDKCNLIKKRGRSGHRLNANNSSFFHLIVMNFIIVVFILTTTTKTTMLAMAENHQSNNNDVVVVDAPVGTLIGKRSSGSSSKNDDDVVETFLGIPYARVGTERRFLPSKLIERLNNDNEQKSTGGAPMCYQAIDPLREPYIGILKLFPQSEECLYLNLYRPNSISSTRSSNDDQLLLPVFVWIHGGGFNLGSGKLNNDHSIFVRNQKDIIVIDINYRLGMFGYLPINDDDEEQPGTGGMNGIHDQIQALHWIQKNIGAFGGNASDVTIVGQSAGSISACYLSVSPLARGLFHRAILMSASCLSPRLVSSFLNTTRTTDFFMKELLLNGNDSLQPALTNIKDLRNQTTYSAKYLAEFATKFSPMFTLYPTIDGWVIPSSKYVTDEEFFVENIHIDEFILGSVSYDETQSSTIDLDYVLANITNEENITSWLRQLYDGYVTTNTASATTAAAIADQEDHKETFVRTIRSMYDPIYYYNNTYLPILKLYSEGSIICDMRHLAQVLLLQKQKQEKKTVYLYSFEHLSSNDLRWGYIMEELNLTIDTSYTSHGSESSILFGNLQQGFLGSSIGEDGSQEDTPLSDDYIVSQNFQRWFGNFVKTGNPNNNNDSDLNSSSSSSSSFLWKSMQYQSSNGDKNNKIVDNSIGKTIPVFVISADGGKMIIDEKKEQRCSIYDDLRRYNRTSSNNIGREEEESNNNNATTTSSPSSTIGVNILLLYISILVSML